MKKQSIYNIPNLLSFYRLLMFPVIMYFILWGKESLFAIFLFINLVTDVLDGWIARAFDQQTELGARLDSMADNLTYLLAILGILVFKGQEFAPHLTSFLIFAGLLLLTIVISLIKFRRFASLHLYSFKIGGYIQGAFFALLFAYGFVEPFYYFMITWGILAALENIIVQLYVRRLKSNAKGLYWVIKENSRE